MLELAGGAAGTRIVAPELFEQLFVSVHHSHAAFHLCLGRESFATFAGDFEV